MNWTEAREVFLKNHNRKTPMMIVCVSGDGNKPDAEFAVMRLEDVAGKRDINV